MKRQHRSTRERSLSRSVPLDLFGIGLFLVVAYGVLSLEAGAIPRVFVGVVALCFVPGYVTTAALFPWNGHEPRKRRTRTETRITLRERVGLSFGLSLGLVPILAIIAGQFTTGFTGTAAFATVAIYALVVGLVAAYRRLQLPADERLYIPFGAWASELRTALTAGSTASRLATLALVCSVVLAAGTFGFALASPTDAETYTDFHLLTVDDDGEYVSAGYPEELVRGNSTQLSWGINSYEATTTEYTVVVTLERVTEEDDQLRRIETAEIDRTTTELEPGEREVHDHEFTPPLVGDDLRLSYYLYRGEAPDTPSTDDAYRHLHIWVDVNAGP